MIIKVTKAEQLPICLDIIHKSFQTVAEDLHLTRENCPGHTAFMPPEKLRAAFDGGCSLFLCRYQNTFCRLFFFAPHSGRRNVGSFGGFTALQTPGARQRTGGLCRRLCKGPLGSTKNSNRHCRRKHGTESLVSVPGVHPHRHKNI